MCIPSFNRLNLVYHVAIRKQEDSAEEKPEVRFGRPEKKENHPKWVVFSKCIANRLALAELGSATGGPAALRKCAGGTFLA
jgi:hypothetical protein